MAALREKLLRAVSLKELTNTLCDAVSIPSVAPNETAMQMFMADLMRDAGMELDEWEIDVDALQDHDAFSCEVDRERPRGLVGVFGQGDGRTLVLNGHVDVVPAGDLSRWTVPPFEGTVRDHRVYGRGAVDMKGGLLCAVFAVKALAEVGVKIPGKIIIQSVIAEEDGGMGTLATVARGHTGDFGIVLEPTELIIAPAQAGASNFRVTIPGRAAHGALRDEGVDPLDKFVVVYSALQELERRRNQDQTDPLFAAYENPYAIACGTIQGGDWASTVAESVRFEGRLGVRVGETMKAARAELVAAIEAAAKSDEWLRVTPPVIEWWGGQFAPAAIPVDHEGVVKLTRALEKVSGHPATVQGMPFGADMRLLVNNGNTPSVLFGPGNVRQAHAPDEYVEIEELGIATHTLITFILDYFGLA